MKRIIELLTNIEHKVKKNIPYINKGGCGVFAYYVGKNLLERNIDFTYKCEDPDADPTGKFVCYNHIWLAIKEYEFNVLPDVHEVTVIELDKEHIEVLYDNSIKNRYYKWNSKYNISDNKKVLAIVNNFFAEYDKL